MIELFIHEVIHGLFALPFAVFLYKKTRSIKSVVILFLVTYLMDLDHLIDYFIYFGSRFELREFLSGIYFHESGRAFVFFHGWEYFVLFLYLAHRNKRRWKSVFTAASLGMLPHLIWDSVNVGTPVVYFILYRASKLFFIF